ncbi:Pimeloyl-ACP methyl ester carboxylesterase [Noviherbaspirillum humi]|uniref:Pimeloyl-ACP methyl ester carboxylesterase n=1 Tax=Noviherbaspirillum humi TaxID=1688639 RepID=A0A239C739_9BURK|nr:alpha/beta hydrolase [Noviherbaspirillum humi]SNS16075.1 Pimeloyl-ACP methyl ester carboxylesterase [Noviherbaspirillum humi]
MNQPSSRYVQCQGREIHFVEWGRPDAPPLLMWHGLARTGRDFDDLAAALADRYRIVCPDTLGRGFSQWSPDPDKEYCLAFYAELARDLADQLGMKQLRWVGTSMGGAIGTVAGATTLKGRISHLVINDNGPALAQAAIERIKAYAGNPPAFATMAEFEQFLRTVYKPYGWQSDAQWRRMAETSARRLPDGRIAPHYDPAMVRQFIVHPRDYDLWPAYDALDMKVMVLRGIDSDLLLQETAEEMTRRGPRARLEVIPGCGHAPALNVPEQIGLVADFLAD